MKGEDLLSLLFLAFVCIIFIGLIKALLPDHSILLVPSFAVICLGLWLAYDYALASRYKKKVECMENQLAEILNAQQDEVYDQEDDQVYDQEDVEDLSACMDNAHVHASSTKLQDYNKKITMKEIHGEMGCSGDTQLYNRMKYTSIQPQLSKDIRASWNARKLQPYLEEELRENENRDWWDREQDKLDLQM